MSRRTGESASKTPTPQIKASATRDNAICHTYMIYFFKTLSGFKKFTDFLSPTKNQRKKYIFHHLKIQNTFSSRV